MRTDTPKTVYLHDYAPYPFEILSLDLTFDIREGDTTVTALTRIKRKEHKTREIFLNGENLELVSLHLDEEPLDIYILDEKGISFTFPQDDSEHVLKVTTLVRPAENTRLEGLYRSEQTYCTQCEAEGFRRITYFPDRPDVLTVYTVRIESDEETCPVLLSNGNKTEQGQLENGRHYCVWHDPFPKPCYLFALVAGRLTHIHDTFTTKSGRNVDLYIYVHPGDESQCDHAMESLKKSMKWDEDVYGLEYDLDIFNIVAVSDFNMGAMENKSLNIFNTALVLAHPDTATDTDFMRVESVIAHEYFHNWSGNRVTCRDWFQLSLKEGLTVYRDQKFSADMHSHDVQRIDDVTHLRRYQFPEDAGPLSHPVRPDNYIEINNFYTMTIYEKGAEVIRMLKIIIGSENYRKGTDLYFSRYDGQAVTCDDFIACMEEVSQQDLTQFKLWYSQAGTPEITFKGDYNPVEKTYTVTLIQKIPDTPGQTNKRAMHIPVAIGLLDPSGQEYALNEKEERTQILHLKEKSQAFTFDNIQYPPVPSILRGFSAPVILKDTLNLENLSLLLRHDPNGFNRWQAGQHSMFNILNDILDNGEQIPEQFFQTYGTLLDECLKPESDKALMARIIQIPSVTEIGQQRKEIDPTAIDNTRDELIKALIGAFKIKFQKIYEQHDNKAENLFTAAAVGSRTLKNTALHLLTNRCMKEDVDLCLNAYEKSQNMTHKIAALQRLAVFRTKSCEETMNEFHDRYKEHPLVIDKWFSLQASASSQETIRIVDQLRTHPEFNIKNPNRVRSLFAAFAMNNPVCFHEQSGKGYELLRSAITELNEINPQIAARLLTPFKDWHHYTPDRQKLMKAALRQIMEIENLSPDVYEITSKSLAN